MPKFEVHFEQTNDVSFVVEAKDKEDARDKADELIVDMTFDELLEQSQRGYWEYTYTDEEGE